MMRAGATPSRPASTVGGLTSVDSTLHVMTANLETLMAVSSVSMPTCTQINQWLSGFSQSEKGVVLCSDTTPTFSHTAPSTYTPSYETPDTWDCITVVSDFPDTVPAHPFDILPRLAPEPFYLHNLLCFWPYTSHCFTEFCPYHTDGDPTELQPTAWPHQTHIHILEHSTFCREYVCPIHYPYGSNK